MRFIFEMLNLPLTIPIYGRGPKPQNISRDTSDCLYTICAKRVSKFQCLQNWNGIVTGTLVYLTAVWGNFHRNQLKESFKKVSV